MKITAQELRVKYLNFFKSKGHTIIPSASLVPENDSSVLFTTAGMHPLVPYLLGQQHPGGRRVTNVQKCIRTGDIDEVGDDTHLTFFEMLGNWSFGDYFKEDAIKWSFGFLTSKEYLNLPLERLAFSVFSGDNDAPRDEEAAGIWRSLGVPESRIAYLPKDDNWWIAGNTGPCGPDTEMFYWIDDGTPAPENFQDTHHDKRWVEIWNDVFMQFEKQADGKLIPLKQQNVDTGMGLDRTLAVLNGQSSVYDTELFSEMWEVIELDQQIMTNDEVRKARIVLDHIRAAVFIVTDGVEPSNKDRGYVLRRLLRRAMVMGRLLNLKHHWLESLMGKVAATYVQAYPPVVEKSENTFKVILAEQQKFEKTLEKGLKEFEKLIKNHSDVGASFSRPPYPSEQRHNPLDEAGRLKAAPAIMGLTGKDAFDLYQTYGFPWELTKELAEQTGQQIDKTEFEEEFKKHQELSRTASAGQFKGGLASHSEKIVRYHTATHLMNAALRKVLGDHVWQKGSNITEERTRFDFTHDKKMTPEEIYQVEVAVNDWIARDLPVKKDILPLEEARKLGAIGVFGAKYPDQVSVYTISDPKTSEIISREFCGGPHVEHTGTIGKFKIQKEEASSAGVRRIKAIIE
ncbi:MAG: alanine--tRNA ligase-related protein [Patescibacteria group bacterium]|nr:alanine--tRNA ligase-related protein [Patescibacteria group bacterium]